MKVEFSEQVRDYLRALPPVPHQRLREAIRRLEKEQGDIQSLEADLMGFHRLRVGRHRVIFWYQVIQGRRVVRCEYAEERSVVYQMFSEIVRHLKS